MTDTTLRVNGTIYNVEAGYQGRVVEVVDTPNEATAWAGIRKRLAARQVRKSQ